MPFNSKRVRPRILALLLPVALIAAWELAVRRGWLPPTLIASPTAALESLTKMATNGTLAVHCGASAERLLAGFFLGAAAGIGLGLVLGMSRLAAQMIEPTISVIAPIPPITFIPLFIILFGIEETSKIALIAFGAFFIVLLHTVEGVRATDQKFVELSRVLGKGLAEFAAKIVIPSALPDIFTGMRIAMGLSWTLLLMAEIISASNGLGWLIWDSRNFSRPDDMLAGMIVVGVLGRATDLALVGVQRLVTPWSTTYGEWQRSVDGPGHRRSQQGIPDR
jgi:sulfonate transport system permease protein